MVGGRLKALGKSLRLKNKYGDGYKITVVVPQKNNVEFVKNEISKASQVAALETEDHIGVSDGKIGSETTKLTYALKNINSCQEIIKSLNLMQSGNLKEEPKISGWGLHQTTLEDVFFKMIKT
jgi:ABC-type multidrug transport system ATPase subunit